MLIKKNSDIPSSEITPESVYLARREFMRGAMSAAALGLGASAAPALAAPTQIADKDLPGPDWLKQQIAGAKANQEKMIALWRKLAERYANEPMIAAYDIINEPNWGFESADDKNAPWLYRARRFQGRPYPRVRVRRIHLP